MMVKIFKIIAISDTHNMHKACEKLIPDGEYDMIIHAGDVSGRGHEYEVRDFVEWFSGLDQFRHKLMIAGNHDWLFEKERLIAREMIPDNVHYLEDNGVTIEGIKFWGSPQTPRFLDWAFNRDRGEDIKRFWDIIDDDVDVLVTHCPAHYKLDYVKYDNKFLGCDDLSNRIMEIKPKVHICGHIHGSYGVEYYDGTMYYNASLVNEQYRPQNPAHIIELEIDENGKVDNKH